MQPEPRSESFELHPRLAADCHTLGHVVEGQILLHRNASLPWFLLVPRTEAEQLHELGAEQRLAIQQRWTQLAAWVEARFECDRVNVAAIGNVVPQLHLHTIGRRKDDPLWPNVPWGQPLPERQWSEDDLDGFRDELKAAIGLTRR